MNEIFLVLICLLIIMLLCAVCCISGLLLGIGSTSRKREKTPATELTEEQKRKLERAQREYANFLTYDGSKQ